MDEKPLILDGLDGYQFEELVARIMKKKGYEKIRVTSKSKDVGKDIIMEDSKGKIILVECKHQQFVGRPIIQKLQGAINHEEEKNNGKEVEGIIVTSGSFSKEAMEYNNEIGHNIELIDGKRLKNLCEELNIFLLNGRVQIIVNDSFRNINENSAKEIASKAYSKIYWSDKLKKSISSDLRYTPACYISYKINFDTYTSIGCIDHYSNSGEIVVDGTTGKNLNEDASEFFFSGRIEKEEIKYKENKKLPFEFTENDIEDHALDLIIKEHTHDVNYVGQNNVSYTKKCVPKRRDIDIKNFIPIYLPSWINDLKIMKMHYKQDFFVNGNKHHFILDELKKCKICESENEEYELMSLCLECGRIVCKNHVKIDYLDKKTPICEIHAKPFKLFIQKKYFAKKNTLDEYKKWWKNAGFFRRLYEDKIAFGLSVTGALVVVISILSQL